MEQVARSNESRSQQQAARSTQTATRKSPRMMNEFQAINFTSLKMLAQMGALLACLGAAAAASASASASATATAEQQQPPPPQMAGPFPGVSRELSSFCAARPSLPIDLATLIVHVKRNVSFNYKLYLFSGEHVFQTGQVIPRDDFRVHSFPVRVKRFADFWPAANLSGQPGGPLNLEQFFRLVPLADETGVSSSSPPELPELRELPELPDDARGEPLPGDHEAPNRSRQQSPPPIEGDPNEYIEFDRDDQIASISTNQARLRHNEQVRRPAAAAAAPMEMNQSKRARQHHFEQLVLPVGSFSSFRVNLTYLVRKDFDQIEPQLIGIKVDASKFQVTEMHVINNGSAGNANSVAAAAAAAANKHDDDFAFLSHKLLRNPNTRITSINQIYEDWITRNYYTIVYVQRRLPVEHHHHHQSTSKENSTSSRLISDRLIFRGSSMALLGADQLDYHVKAAAFITEKNGLHYYLEFLSTGKFYLCAIDWQKRPFKIIDWQQFPIKATKTQFDNEELLLCPPAVCYSDRPIDEIVAYGRLNLAEQIQRQLADFLASSSRAPPSATTATTTAAATATTRHASQHDSKPDGSAASNATATVSALIGKHPGSNRTDEMMAVNLDEIIESVRMVARGEQQPTTTSTRLHLRDWVWPLGGGAGRRAPFKWRYELAQRNDIKAKPDAYGYTLAGHEIDASYRVYNELYLISSNHLIAINYTLANETVVSSILVGEEFPGLISTLIDPITGAFYDRPTNRLYFFKGDRYIGFDYATKRPLDEFVLKPGYLHSALLAGLDAGAHADGPQLLASLPVVEMLGRQHQVDAIYHDLATDLVHIFTGMKFYTFQASDFKDGAFRSKSGQLPQMFCINERFLDGCQFDQAYPNPCQSGPAESNELNDNKPTSSTPGDGQSKASAKLEEARAPTSAVAADSSRKAAAADDGGQRSAGSSEFSLNQQMKLRSIASRAGLLSLLAENKLINEGIRSIEIGGPDLVASGNSPRDQERLVIYLLIGIVLVTILMTIVMILVMLKSTFGKESRVKRANHLAYEQQTNASNHLATAQRQLRDKLGGGGGGGPQMVKRIAQHSHLVGHKSGQTQAAGLRLPPIGGTTSGSKKAAASSPVRVVMGKGRRNHGADHIDNSVL